MSAFVLISQIIFVGYVISTVYTNSCVRKLRAIVAMLGCVLLILPMIVSTWRVFLSNKLFETINFTLELIDIKDSLWISSTLGGMICITYILTTLQDEFHKHTK